MVDALKIVHHLLDLPEPAGHHNTAGRSKGDAYAQDLVSLLVEHANQDTLPEFVVPSHMLGKLPLNTLQEGDPSILVRMERLENVVTQCVQGLNKMVSLAAAPAKAAPVITGQVDKEVVARPDGRFGAALERARSLSRSREQVVVRREEQGSQQSAESQVTSWADVAGAGAGTQSRVKRPRPGDIDSEGFLMPGRPPRKAIPKGSSKVDFSEIGAVMVAPIDRYIGNTDLRVTSDVVKAALNKCAAGIENMPKLDILDVKRINGDLPNAKTAAWKVTVPYECRELMDNPLTYPPGWTHRAYFAPRGEKTKRIRQGEVRSSLVEGLIQENSRAETMTEQDERNQRYQQAVAEGIAAALAEGVSGVPATSPASLA